MGESGRRMRPKLCSQRTGSGPSWVVLSLVESECFLNKQEANTYSGSESRLELAAVGMDEWGEMLAGWGKRKLSAAHHLGGRSSSNPSTGFVADRLVLPVFKIASGCQVLLQSHTKRNLS